MLKVTVKCWRHLDPFNTICHNFKHRVYNVSKLRILFHHQQDFFFFDKKRSKSFLPEVVLFHVRGSQFLELP